MEIVSRICVRFQVGRKLSVRPLQEVPGPRGWPLIGTLLDYINKDGPSFGKMFEMNRKRALQYGPIFQEKIVTERMVVISDPEEYRKVIHADGRTPTRCPLPPMVQHQKKNGHNIGIVNSQGKDWQKYRSVFNRKLLVPDEIHKYSRAMNTVATDFVHRLQQQYQLENGEMKELDKELFRWAMESIGTVLFEERIGCLRPETSKLSEAFIKNLQGFTAQMQLLLYSMPLYRLWPTKQWRTFENYANNVTNIGSIFIKNRMDALKHRMKNKENNGKESKFLTFLLTQKSLTFKEITSATVELLTAAVETSSNTTLWALYCLAKNPDAQERVRYEIMQNLTHGNEITVEDLRRLPIVKACIKETLRLYPVVHVTSRLLAKDIQVCGYHLPKGTHVQANVYGMGRNSDLFPSPLEFRPERWIGKRSDNNCRLLYNLSFGHGARMCIGRRIAEQQISIVLIKILQHFRLEYYHEDVQPELKLIMTPDRPVRIQFIPCQMSKMT